MNNPIYEGVLLKCAQYKVDMKYVPKIYELTLLKNSLLKQATVKIRNGKMHV